MAFEQNLKNTQNAKIEKVYFSVNLNLDHSDVTLQNTFFSSNIKGINDTQKNLAIKDSLLESHIQMSNLQVEKSAIYRKVDAKKLVQIIQYLKSMWILKILKQIILILRKAHKE